jgi:hypothetical protein
VPAEDRTHLQRSPVIHVTRFVMYTLDFCVHVLAPAGEYLTEGLTARCGQVLPIDVFQHDQPPPGSPCESCRLMCLESFIAGGSSRTSGPAD